MSETPYYKKHWLQIDGPRLRRYAAMFTWNPASLALYESAHIGKGHKVLDFGCGPGHTVVEICNWVGDEGHVHGCDINQGFLSECRQVAADAGRSAQTTFHKGTDGPLDLPDGALDRVTTRNTLIYVDDPVATLREFRRLLAPGGRVHAIEGDWPLMVAEPIETELWRRIVLAAGAHACRTPQIGRRLPGLLAAAGFDHIELQVITRPDRDGRLFPMIRSICDYAKDGGKIDPHEIDSALAQLEAGLDKGTYLVLAPQFVVAANR